MIKHDPVSDWQAAVTVLQELAGAAEAPRRSPEAVPALAEPTAHSDAAPLRSAQAAAGADLGTTGLVDAWSEQTLRTLLETLPDALAVISRAGAIVLVNQETEKIFGYQRRELLGQPIEILIPQRFHHVHVSNRQEYFKSPRSRPMGDQRALYGRRKDGTEFPVEISLSPLVTEQGVFAMSVIRDISRRRRDEAKFRTLIENIPAVTFIAPLDTSAPELYVSPQVEQLLGFSQQEWLEDPVLWHRQLHPDDRERWNHEFAPTCRSGKPFRSIYRFVAKDGRVVWVHGSASIVNDANGKPSFLQGIAFDITTIKHAEAASREAEEALRRINVELDRRVQERTEELTRSLAALQDKTDELKQFAYRAAHDLKKPLTSLVSWPQKLARDYGTKIDATFDELIGKTINGAKRMRRLIDGIEGYSEYLQRERELPAVDCAMLVEEARANLQADIEASGAVVAAEKLPVVIGNPHLLMLLFQNLIGNAIKYRRPETSLRVDIGAEPCQGGWRFWVRDNGMGIEEKFFKKIFLLGERLHTEAKIPGNGYGLCICEKIVARRGGRIWVESRLGEGSTFFFTWPAPG